MFCNVIGEVRGTEKRVSAKGKEYYSIHCEDLETGKPFSLASYEPLGLSKGRTYDMYCEVQRSSDYLGFLVKSFSEIEL